MTDDLNKAVITQARKLAEDHAAPGPVTGGFWDGTSLFVVDRGTAAGAAPDSHAGSHHGERQGFLIRASATDDGSRLGARTGVQGDATIERAALAGLEPAQLWQALPHTRPRPLARVARTFGTGDRLGMSAEAHSQAFIGRDAAPVLAQQSVRELTLTGRSYADVARAAAIGVIESGYAGPFGFDGDHLKNLEEVEQAVDAGCSMLTLDLSGFLDRRGVDVPAGGLDPVWAEVPEAVRSHWMRSYAGNTVTVGETRYTLSQEDVQRTAVTFYRSLPFLEEVWALLRRKGRAEIDIEVSVDEAGVDTTIPQHNMLVRELIAREIPITSLAPKFVGEFEKAIDYQGDIAALRMDMDRHARLAEMLGDYKLSIHSGSDKFLVFPLVEEVTRGRYHLKTSGTFWLEAVRTLADTAPTLFAQVFHRAWDVFEDMMAHYHLSGSKSRITAVAEREVADYGRYLVEPDGRQLLHVSYGAVLQDADFRAQVLDALIEGRAVYLEHTLSHTRRHMDSLGIPAEG